MTRTFKYLIAAAAAMLASEAQSQDRTEPDTNQIVVEGRRDGEAEIKGLIGTLPHASSIGHISRFERPACPNVAGVPPEQRALTVERMRKVGAAAGIQIARPGCRTNVLVIVTPDKRQLFEQLRAHHAYLFGELSNREIATLESDPAPAALWHVKGLVDADGREYAPTSMEGIPARQTSRKGSRISDFAHQDLFAAVLVVEQGALPGLSTTQLADYAAMRVFTGADPARLPDRRISSILTILDAPADAEVPVTLTPWDLAFLKSLYASNPAIYAPGQRGEIRSRMKKEMGVSEGDGG
jgi:hypothetical protein